MAMNPVERIRQLAYEIWEREGRPHGRDVEHWHRATASYQGEVDAPRLDNAGKPMEGLATPQKRTRRPSAVASPDAAAATQPATSDAVAPRRRRSKSDMVAAAAGVVGAAAAVAATVAATKRRRGTKVEAPDAAPEAEAAPRRARRSRPGSALPEAEPAPADMASDAEGGAGAGLPADEDPGGATAMPGPAAEPPSDAAPETDGSEVPPGVE